MRIQPTTEDALIIAKRIDKLLWQAMAPGAKIPECLRIAKSAMFDYTVFK